MALVAVTPDPLDLPALLAEISAGADGDGALTSFAGVATPSLVSAPVHAASATNEPIAST